MTHHEVTGLSARGEKFRDAGSVRDQFATIWSDAYHIEKNPGGTLNLGTSENYVMVDDVARFLQENLKLTGSNIDYGEGPWGNLRLRKAMARYMDKWFRPVSPVDPDHLLFASGVTCLGEMLGFTIFEPGEGLLLSAPIYQAFRDDFGLRAEVNTIFVPFHRIDQFTLEAVKCWEQAIISANESGTKIRAILICNPHNPLGQCYDPDSLIAYMKLCQKYSIHLIVDEIYALSVYDVAQDTSVPAKKLPIPFKSVLAIESKEYIDPTYLHVLYGFSKDLASSGIRVGCLWSQNTALLRAVGGMSLFNWTSNISEAIAITMLEDEAWMESFLQKSRARLGERAAFARSVLDQNKIPYEKGACAGFFLWLDLRPFLAREKGAKVTWDDERAFVKKMQDKRVYLTNGEIMSSEEPGFFRLCFVKNEQEVREGLNRLVEVLGSTDSKVLQIRLNLQ